MMKCFFLFEEIKNSFPRNEQKEEESLENDLLEKVTCKMDFFLNNIQQENEKFIEENRFLKQNIGFFK